MKAQDEVRVVRGRAEEVILLDGLGERPAGEAAILHAPKFRIAFPTGERASIEDRLGIDQLGRGCRVQGNGGDNDGDDKGKTAGDVAD